MVSAQTEISRELAGGDHARGSADEGVNVGSAERWLSVAGGGLLALYGLREGTLPGFGLAALGAGLLYRGLSGHCPAYGVMGASTATRHNPAAAVAAGAGVRVVRGTVVNRPSRELYRTWRDLASLPRFMSHLVAVTVDGQRSHWVAHGPAGMNVEWDAEIVNDQLDRLIAWRSLEGSQIATAGSVRFDPLPGDRGTLVKVTLKYDPPGGTLGSWLSWLFGQEPGVQVREDLRRFKRLMETGETPTVEGQPSGRA